jgi:hypothetical protein
LVVGSCKHDVHDSVLFGSTPLRSKISNVYEDGLAEPVSVQRFCRFRLQAGYPRQRSLGTAPLQSKISDVYDYRLAVRSVYNIFDV